MSSNHPQETSAIRTACVRTPLTLTKITNLKGSLTKEYRQGKDGQPVKTTSAALVDGLAEQVQCADLRAFLKLRDELTHDEALVYGVAKNKSIGLTTQKNLRRHPGKIARDSKSFTFQAGLPGILMLDHDFDHLAVEYERDELRVELLRAVPELAGAPMAWAPSASSYIGDATTELYGLRGQRLYIAVLDASDIPRIGRLIYERLWDYGLGCYAVSKAGCLLDRNLFDSSVWQPERIDFAAGAKCFPPLVQRAPPGKVWNNTAPPWDSKALLGLTTEQEAQAAEYRHQARAVVAGEREEKYTAFTESRAAEWVGKGGIDLDEARRQARAAVDLGYLPSSLVLHPEKGRPVTVADVLANPKKWNGERFGDPLEPDYRGDKRIAILNLDNLSKPFIFSHAHGSATYELSQRRPVVDDFEVLEVLPSEPSRVETRFKLLRSADLHALPPLEWRVRGVLPSRGVVGLYGPSGSGKSFLALDMAAAIASGGSWFGYRVKSAPVVYCALEGESGFRLRVAAWEQANGRTLPDDLRLMLESFKLTDSQDMRGLAAVVLGAGAGAVTILDTLNRAAPTADENSSSDMGGILEAVKELQRLTGGLVVLVHHTGKDTTKGLRGHSSLFAALDAAVEVTRDGDRRAWRVAKAKDGADGAGHPFRLDVVALGDDEEGDPLTSCVVHKDTTAVDIQRVKVPQGICQRLVYDGIRGLFEFGEFGMAGAPPHRPCIELEAAVLAGGARLVCPTDKRTSRSRRAISGLVARGVLGQNEGWLWHS